MALSAAEAIGPAFSRTMHICFKPFDIGKWFVMGFCAFLSTCGEGGGGNFNSFNPSGGGGGGGPSGADISHFFTTYLGWIIAGAIALLLLIIAITLVVTYLRCRGRFMFLDNIAANRAAVVEPWHRYAAQATSYFWFCVLLMAITCGALLVIGLVSLLIALPNIQAHEFGGMAIAAIVIGVLLLIPTIIALTVVQIFAYDFVVPIMMIRGTSFAPAWREAKDTVRRGHIGQLIVFYLLKFVLGMATGIIAIMAICATCCIGALPYLSSVLLLPILVFSRVFALTFLEQFHADYRLMTDLPFSGAGFPVDVTPNPPPPGA
jgi:hypothetical protein